MSVILCKCMASKVNYFLFCEHFSRDAHGRVSLSTVFDVVGGDKLPIVPPKFTIVFNVSIDQGDIKDGKVTFRIVLQSKKGKELVKIEALAEVSEAGKVGSSIPLDGRILFAEQGPYQASLFINDKQIGESGLEVVVAKQEDFKK